MTSYETEQTIPTQDELVRSAEYMVSLTKYIQNVSAAGRKIDGYDGAVSSVTMRKSGYQGLDTYVALYHLSSTTSVSIVSTYPWDEGTLNLLKTIHVEEINATT